MTQNYDYLVFDKNIPDEVKANLVECKINYSIIQKRAYVLTLDAPLELAELIKYNFYKVIYSHKQYALLAQKSLRFLCEAPYSEQMYHDIQDESTNKEAIEALITTLGELYSSMMVIIPQNEFTPFFQRILDMFMDIQTHRETIGFDTPFQIVVGSKEEGDEIDEIDDNLYLDDDSANFENDSVEAAEPSSNNPLLLSSRNIH